MFDASWRCVKKSVVIVIIAVHSDNFFSFIQGIACVSLKSCWCVPPFREGYERVTLLLDYRLKIMDEGHVKKNQDPEEDEEIEQNEDGTFDESRFPEAMERTQTGRKTSIFKYYSFNEKGESDRLLF